MASTGMDTPPEDQRTDARNNTIAAVLPQSRLIWFAFGLSALLFIGGMAISGPMAAIMGVWGLTILGGTAIGYAIYRVWYHVGA